eukprot:gene13756-29263_t
MFARWRVNRFPESADVINTSAASSSGSGPGSMNQSHKQQPELFHSGDPRSYSSGIDTYTQHTYKLYSLPIPFPCLELDAWDDASHWNVGNNNNSNNNINNSNTLGRTQLSLDPTAVAGYAASIAFSTHWLATRLLRIVEKIHRTVSKEESKRRNRSAGRPTPTQSLLVPWGGGGGGGVSGADFASQVSHRSGQVLPPPSPLSDRQIASKKEMGTTGSSAVCGTGTMKGDKDEDEDEATRTLRHMSQVNEGLHDYLRSISNDDGISRMTDYKRIDLLLDKWIVYQFSAFLLEAVLELQQLGDESISMLRSELQAVCFYFLAPLARPTTQTQTQRKLQHEKETDTERTVSHHH